MTASEDKDNKTLRVTLTKSLITEKGSLRRVVQALGLRRFGQTVEHKDTDSIRGMIRKVSYLVTVEEKDKS